VIQGELELTIDGVAQIVKLGIVPANVRHACRWQRKGLGERGGSPFPRLNTQ